MIIASFFKTDEHYAGFIVSGHSGYDEEGKDIVCAGVSSAVQMSLNTITEICGVKADIKIEEDTIVLILPQDLSGEQRKICEIVLKGLELQITRLSEDYKGYVSLKNKH